MEAKPAAVSPWDRMKKRPLPQLEKAVVFPEQMNIIADVKQVRTVAWECLRILPLGEHQLAVQVCV